MKAHIIISYSDGGSAFGHSLRLPDAETAIPHALKPSFNGTPNPDEYSGNAGSWESEGNQCGPARMELALFSEDRVLALRASPSTTCPVASGNPGPLIVFLTGHIAYHIHRVHCDICSRPGKARTRALVQLCQYPIWEEGTDKIVATMRRECGACRNSVK